MINITGITTLDMSRKQKKLFLDSVAEAIASVFESYTFFLDENQAEYASQCAKNQIHFISFVESRVSEVQKRNLIVALHDALIETVGFKGNLKDIVIFKYVDSESRGFAGEQGNPAASACARKGGA
jgi:phenylpyruvate tautomerase PptA (4-oxalocrotonate tautomerase family)